MGVDLLQEQWDDVTVAKPDALKVETLDLTSNQQPLGKLAST